MEISKLGLRALVRLTFSIAFIAISVVFIMFGTIQVNAPAVVFSLIAWIVIECIGMFSDKLQGGRK